MEQTGFKPTLVIAGEQPELFNADALPRGLELLLPEEKQRQQFTAERVAHNQEKYRMIVQAIAQDLPVRMICHAFGISHHTVKAVREREPELIATEKQRVSRLLGHAARMSAEAFLDKLEAGAVPANVLPVAAAIFLDKKALIDGEATSRVEHVSGLPSVEELAAELKKLDALDIPSEVRSEAKPTETP
jgi:hypothetical protein